MATAIICEFSTAWSMPNRWTFDIPPIRDFVRRWRERAGFLNAGEAIVVDPFCGHASEWSTHTNDLAFGGKDAEEFCLDLVRQGLRANMVIFDPPYSPRQIADCYKGLGLTVTQRDTQSAALYRRVRKALDALLAPGGVALSFGWQSGGFGKGYDTAEILLCQHGGAHNDTICVAQFKR